LKYYSWEEFIENNLGAIRDREMDVLKKFNLNLGQIDTLVQVSPSIIRYFKKKNFDFYDLLNN
jgi:hypothetical protein